MHQLDDALPEMYRELFLDQFKLTLWRVAGTALGWPILATARGGYDDVMLQWRHRRVTIRSRQARRWRHGLLMLLQLVNRWIIRSTTQGQRFRYFQTQTWCRRRVGNCNTHKINNCMQNCFAYMWIRVIESVPSSLGLIHFLLCFRSTVGL